MGQSSFLPVLCDRWKGPPNGAVDADCIAIQSSTQKRFLCKSSKRAPNLPATEWICASLARAIGIPVADWVVVQLCGRDDLLFGSVWEGGAVDALTSLKEVSNPEIFSDTFAYDLSIHNVDRKLGNFLFLNAADDIVVKIIDASRAFIHHGLPLPPVPFSMWDNTMSSRKVIEECHPFDRARAHAILGHISQLPDDWMEFILNGMPQQWLQDIEADRLCKWWENERSERLLSVRNII